jgi:hypothetical protein
MLKLRDLSTMSPCVTKPIVTLYGEKHTLAPLAEDELDTFKAQLADILMIPGSDERLLMEDRLEQYVYALRSIKHELNDIHFDGLNPGDNTLGFGLIRPQYTHAGAATYKPTWITPALGLLFVDWLMEGALAPFAIGRDFGLCITHLKSYTSPNPVMAECPFVIGRTTLVPSPVRGLRIADTKNGISLVSIPTMILKPTTTFRAQARSDIVAGAADEVELGGLVFGKGKVLTELVPTWL